MAIVVLSAVACNAEPTGEALPLSSNNPPPPTEATLDVDGSAIGLQLCVPEPTTFIAVSANLDASEWVPLTPWNLQNPYATTNSSIQHFVYDRKGLPLWISIGFVRIDSRKFRWHGFYLAKSQWEPTRSAFVDIGSGVLTFGVDGTLQQIAGDTLDIPCVSCSKEEKPTRVRLCLGARNSPDLPDLGRLTSIDGPTSLTRLVLDGRGDLCPT